MVMDVLLSRWNLGWQNYNSWWFSRITLPCFLWCISTHGSTINLFLSHHSSVLKLKRPETSSLSLSFVLPVYSPNNNTHGNRDKKAGTRHASNNTEITHMFLFFVIWCCRLISMLDTTTNRKHGHVYCVGYVAFGQGFHDSGILNQCCTLLHTFLPNHYADTSIQITPEVPWKCLKLKGI